MFFSSLSLSLKHSETPRNTQICIETDPLNDSQNNPSQESTGTKMMGLGRLVVTLKSKIRSLKMKKPYEKVEKSESMRMEIRSRKARKLIEETLKVADSPKSKNFAF